MMEIAGNEDASSLKLRIGDIIFLNLEDAFGTEGQWYLCADGYLGDNVFLSSKAEDFHYGLWEVCVQYQYSSFSEYDEGMQANLRRGLENGGGHNDDFEELFAGEFRRGDEETRAQDLPNSERQSKEVMRQLRRAALNEKLLNEKTMSMKIGSPVLFGDVLQLRHVVSRKFLAVSTAQLAKRERENMRVTCIQNGNAMSAMVFNPRQQYNSDHLYVPNTSEVYIKIHERPGEFLRGAKPVKKKQYNEQGEANSSLEKTPWVINVYHSASQTSSKDICTGRLVSLSDTETRSMLSVQPKIAAHLKNEPAHSSVDLYKDRKDKGQLVMQGRRPEDSENGVNCLWRIEKKLVVRGGNIRFSGESVVLCHLNSNMYLHSRSSDGSLLVVSDRSRATEFDLSNATLQHAVTGRQSTTHVEEGCEVTMSTVVGYGLKKLGLGSSPLYISGNVKKTSATSELIVQPDVTAALTFSVSNKIQSQVGADIYFGIDCCRCLDNFRELAAHLKPDETFDSPHMIAASQGFNRLMECLSQVLTWLFIKDMHAKNVKVEESLGLEPSSMEILRVRQGMMREQGVLDAILLLLNECLTGKYDLIKSAAGAHLNMHSALASLGARGSRGSILDVGEDENSASGDDSPKPSKKSCGGKSDTKSSKALEASPVPASSSGRFKGLRNMSDVSASEKQGTADAIAVGTQTRRSIVASMTSLFTRGNSTVNIASSRKEKVDNSNSDSDGNSNSDTDSEKSSSDDSGDFNTNGEDKKIPTLSAAPAQHTVTKTTTRRMSSITSKTPMNRQLTNMPSSMTSRGGLVMTSQDSSLGKHGGEKVPKILNSKKQTASLELADALLRSLALCIHNNSNSQLHVSENMSILLNHVTTQEYAVYCLHELFKDNQSILQTKIRQKEIDIFINLLNLSEMNVSFLKLLQSTCTCPGGIDSTQRMVTIALFGIGDVKSSSDGDSPRANPVVKRRLTLKMFADSDKRMNKKYVWIKQGVYSYFPPSSSPELNALTTGILGFDLLVHGLPEIYVSWEAINVSKSMIKLFGVPDHVPFHLLTESYKKVYCVMRMKFVQNGSRLSKKALLDAQRRTSSVTTNYSKVAKNNLEKLSHRATTVQVKKGASVSLSTDDEYKSLIAEYMLTELSLVADLCLDRNYVAIHILESAFPYDMLIAVLRDDRVNAVFKARICRILRCLWIDREPQTVAVFPRLIRSSMSTKEDASAFTKHHKGSPYSFCLLQQTIAEYFHSIISIDNCNELSVEMSAMTLMLMKFGFYSKDDHLRDITWPLIRLLDHMKYLKLFKDGSLHGKHAIRKASTWTGGKKPDGNTSDISRLESSDLSHHDEGLAQFTENLKHKYSDTSQERGVLGTAWNKFYSWMPWSSAYGAKIIPHKHETVSDILKNDTMIETDELLDFNNDKAVYRTDRQMLANKRKESENTASNENMWEANYLRWSESVVGMLLVMSVVTLTVTVSMLQLLQSNKSSGLKTQNVIDTVDESCSVFFVVELWMRAYCVVRVHGVRSGATVEYFSNVMNFLDLVLVILDISLYFLGIDGGAGIGAARASKIVKGIRFIRLIRVIRVVRIMNLLKDKAAARTEWILPERFSQVHKFKAQTMTTVLRNLRVVFDRIQDNSLEMVIDSFQAWTDADKKEGMPGQLTDGNAVDLTIYIEKLLSQDGSLGLVPERFDKVLADLIMYNDADLCNEAFTLLRQQLDKGNILSALAADIQIIYSPKVETKLKEAKEILQGMRRSAEMYEIWQDLDIEENYETAEQLNNMIKTLSNMMRKSNDDCTLSMKMEFIPDEEVQNLLRNLDALHVFMTVLESLYDGGRAVLNNKIIKIMKNCIQMVCLFVDSNDQNQQLAFQKINFFVNTLNDGINSADCMHYILQGNIVLVKNCHKRFVEEFAQLIFTYGQKPEYIRVFSAMTMGLHDQDSNIKSVQNNIGRFLTSREWQTRILLWCCSPDSNAYAQRAHAMSQYPDKKDRPIPLEDLSSDLQYHILLLHVMARCNLGPKLQAIYQLDDIVHAILDKNTIFSVKIALGRCLEQLVCNGADLFISSEYMWLFFENFVEYLAVIDRELTLLFRRPVSMHTCLTKKQIGEWVEICLTIVTIFFAVLDISIFGEILDHDLAVKRTQRSEIEIQSIIKKLYSVIRSLLESHIMRVGPIIHERGNYALVSLCRHNSGLTYDLKATSRMLPKKARGSVTLADVQQLRLRHKFATFTERLQSTEFTQNESSMNFIAELPPISDTGNHDVRLEPFITKLVDHIRSNMVDTSLSRSLTSNYEESIWLLKTLRRLFEKHLKQSVEYSIDINLANCEDSKQTTFWRKTFNECGVTELCLDFIAVGIKTPLTLEAVNLLVVLLARHGGCLDVQASIYKSLKNRDSSLFFLQIKEFLGDILMWYQKEAESVEIQTDVEEYIMVLPDENSVFTLLQLMCNCGYLPLKNYMREQEGNASQVNIPSMLATMLDYLSRRESPLFTHMTIYVVKTIRLLMHGPCRENQKYFIMGTEVLISLNRLIRLSRPKTQVLTIAWNLNIEKLKECIIDALRSCVEGFVKSSAIYDRLMSCIELNVLSMLLMPGEDDAHDVLEFGFTPREIKYMVFLSFLERPSYLDGLHASCIVKSNECIRFVEVLWQGSIHRLYFKTPNILEDLSETYLQAVQERDGASQEDKLTSFLGAVKALYTEAKHQQHLKQYGISYLWSRRNYLSWFLFFIGCAINWMLLNYYHRDPVSNEVHMGQDMTEEEADVTLAMHILILVQICMSFMMFLLYITVRVPANYKSNIQTGHSRLRSLLITLLDPLVWWYVVLVSVSILGYIKDPIFSVVFMLEWVVLDNTTRNLLKAVYYPFRQLVATLTMLVIVIHIFSGVYFSIYYHDMETNHVQPIYDLFSSLKLALTYGLRGEYGVDHEFHTTLGSRMVLDLTFYFIVLATLRHIFFAIIVETFGQLREMSNERTEKLHNSCFICGIERHDFEKAGLSTSFHHHREVVHSIQNYVHFIFAVLEQEPHEDLGIEMHVRQCIAEMDISWIPIGLDSFYSSVRQSKEVLKKRGSHNVSNKGGINDAAVSNKLEAQTAKNASGLDILNDVRDAEGRDRSNSRTILNIDDDPSSKPQAGEIYRTTTNGSTNEILRAIQNMGAQMTTISTRLDALEGSGGGGGIVSGVGVLSTVSASFHPNRISAGRPGRQPQASVSQERSQLRGPSEAILMAQLPSFTATAPTPEARPAARLTVVRPTFQREDARDDETKDFSK